MNAPISGQPENEAPASLRKRLESIDAFRGFTIAAMIFVIAVSGYKDLPLTFPHFGSAPVTTFKHAGDDGDPESWAFYESGEKTPPNRKISDEKSAERPPAQGYALAEITGTNPTDARRYNAKIVDGDAETSGEIFHNIAIVTARPLRIHDKAIAVFQANGAHQYDISPQHLQSTGNGCTFTDLVAPFFVFIVGVCIPLSRVSRKKGWWNHALKRTGFLILAGVIYMSLILKLGYWWGILQAIGIAYLLGVVLMRIPWWARVICVLVLAAFHQWATFHIRGWVTLGDPSKPFFNIIQFHDWLEGKPLDVDFLGPLAVHCTPWASISYGFCTVIGTIIGDAVLTRTPQKIIVSCLGVGVVFGTIGMVMHYHSFPINKDVVSSSYTLFTSGVAAITFLLFYLVIDVAGLVAWSWPLRVFGMNALLAYFMQPFVRIPFIGLGIQPFFGHRGGWEGMLWGAIWTLIIWLLTLYCNRRKWFWKL